MTALPSYWDPTILEGLYYADVIAETPGKFTYALTANDLVWDSWYDAATDAEIYTINSAEWAAAHRFSSFIISHQIFANEFGDGACMINSAKDLGAVCLMVTSTTTATTFRPDQDQWDQIISTDPSVATHIAYYNKMNDNNYGKITVGTTTGIDYMDAYHCERIDSTNYEIICSAYQPDWNVDRLTAGYPRFGVDENDLTAVIFDASATTKAQVYDIFLAGGVNLVASVAVVASAVLSSF